MGGMGSCQVVVYDAGKCNGESGCLMGLPRCGEMGECLDICGEDMILDT